MPEGTDPVVYRYAGGGRRYFRGVPRRDLTAADLARLSRENRRHVEAGTIYEAVATKAAKAAVKEADKAAKE